MPESTLIKTHGIVATNWQIKAAAEGKLGAIVLPLVPEPEFDGYLWAWSPANQKALKVWAKDLPFDAYDLLDYQVGDRVYLQEKWIVSSRKEAPEAKSFFPPDSETDDLINWRSAQSMPPDAAKFWYEVTGIQVTPIQNLSASTLLSAALTNVGANYPVVPTVTKIDPDDPDLIVNANQVIRQEQCRWKWDYQFPRYRWNGDRHVIGVEIATIDIYSL